ncbi:MAG TPA: hypothetical protein VM098_06815 [Phycisphaerae bacterium]|nr:hypothetical protein [Phycisphaerae bacterium]
MRTAWIAALPALLCAAACDGLRDKRSQPAPVAQVDKVELRMPLQPLVDLDGKPGYDGLICEVRFYRLDEGRSVPVTGMLELLLYEGRVARVDLGRLKPFIAVTYTRRELLGMEGTDRFGLLSYRVPLAWGPKPPAGSVITLVARYIPPQGRSVYSDPTSVSMRPS